MIKFSKEKNIWIIRNDVFEYQIGLKNEKVYHIAMLPIDKIQQIDMEDQLKRYLDFPVEAEVNVNHEGLEVTHGTRQICCKSSKRAKYISHNIVKQANSEKLEIVQLDEETGLQIILHYEIFSDSNALRRYVEVKNTSEKNIEITHLASFKLQGMPLLSENDLAEEVYLHTFDSSWSWEGNKRVKSMNELGLHSKDSRHAWHIENTSSWVCQEYSPFFVIEERTAQVFWAIQLEHSGSWRFELGGSGLEGFNWLYAQGGLGNFVHAHWSKRLEPQESFKSIPVSIALGEKDIDNVLNEMRNHQANILINRNQADKKLPTVFNEWLTTKGNCREESILQHIDILEKTGVEVYMIDCGWFSNYGTNDGSESWWVTPGDWEVHPKRFPNGLEYVVDKIKEKGMIPGIWLEIEVVGEFSKAYTEQEHLLMKRGEYFVSDFMRRFMYFGYEETRKRATEVFEGLIERGIRYFKIDYNVDCAPGCDNSGDSLGQGMVDHVRGYYQWIEELRANHPEIIIENCSSGGMRLDYGMLSRTDLASITDQESFDNISTIAYGLSNIIHPSQLGVWVNSRAKMEDNEFYFSIISSFMGRVHLSGDIENFSDEQVDMYKKGIDFYKSYREILSSAKVYHHTDSVSHSINKGWNILQINSEDNNTIVVLGFRFDSASAYKKVVLKDIDAKSNYKITHFPAEVEEVVTGKKIIENGFEIYNKGKYHARAYKLVKVN